MYYDIMLYCVILCQAKVDDLGDCGRTACHIMPLFTTTTTTAAATTTTTTAAAATTTVDDRDLSACLVQLSVAGRAVEREAASEGSRAVRPALTI